MAIIFDGTQGIAGTGSLTGMTLANTAISGSITNSQLASSAQYNGFKNRIINGAMMVDQRNGGGSITPASGITYTVDRWHLNLSQASKVSAQRNAGSVTPPNEFTNYLGLTSQSAYSVLSGDYHTLRQAIEGYNLTDFNWGTANAKTATLSFWVRSSLTGTFGGSINNADYTRSYPYTYTINAANTWEYKTVIIPGDTSGTWLTNDSAGINIGFGFGTGSTFLGTAGTWSGSSLLGATGQTNLLGTNGATFYITGVQFEKNSTATGFEYRDYARELVLCQRYTNIFYGGIYGSFMISGSTFALNIALPVSMRAQPTFSTNISDSNFVVAGPNSSQWAMYIQNSGFNSYSGSINTLSLNSAPSTYGAGGNWVQIGTYGCTLNSFTGFLLGSSRYFSFVAEI